MPTTKQEFIEKVLHSKVLSEENKKTLIDLFEIFSLEELHVFTELLAKEETITKNINQDYEKKVLQLESDFAIALKTTQRGTLKNALQIEEKNESKQDDMAEEELLKKIADL